MKNQYVFRFLSTPLEQHSHKVNTDACDCLRQVERNSSELHAVYPAHTCVDHPILPCPACQKWTGDGFATVRSNPQCFPSIAIPEPEPNIVTSVMIEGAKMRINKSCGGNSYIDWRTIGMRHLPSSFDSTRPTPRFEATTAPKSITASHNSALVIESHDSLAVFFARSLKDRGYAVRTARDAEEGLRLYRDCGPYSVVLISYYVPRKSGACVDCFKPQENWAELAMSIRDINRSQSMIIAALDYLGQEDVQRPEELSHVPLLTDISNFRLQKLLEKLEIENAIESLTRAELLKLQKYATFRIRGLGRAARGRTGADLLNEAMLRTLIGTLPAGEGRRWNKQVNFALHLAGVMRSISSYWKRKFDEREAFLEAEVLPMPGGERSEVSPLDQVVSGQALPEQTYLVKESEERIFELFREDFEATVVIRGFLQGMKRNEIRRRYGLTEKQYEAALRRIRVRLPIGKNPRNGGGKDAR